MLYLITLIILFFSYLLYLYYWNKIKSFYMNNSYQNCNSKSNIKILSFNINLLPHTFKKLDFLEKLILTHEIIFLQEFFTNIWFCKKKWLINFCKEYNYNVVTNDNIDLLNYKFVDSGLVILSKYKILDTINYNFNFSEEIDKFSNKGILYAKIKIDNTIINLFNTHLQAQYTNKISINSIKKSQLSELNLFINQIIEKNNNIIVGGDFNISPQNSNDYFKSFNLCHSNEATVYTKYNSDGIEIDSISTPLEGYEHNLFDYFYTKNLNIKVISIPTTFSDHKFLSGVLMF